MPAIFYLVKALEQHTNFDFNRACNNVLDLYKKELNNFDKSRVGLSVFEITIPFPRENLRYWQKINKRIRNALTNEAKMLRYRIVGTSIKNENIFCFIKVALAAEQTEGEPNTKDEQHLASNEENIWRDVTKKILSIAERFRAVLRSHGNDYQKDPELLIFELSKTATNWHNDLVKAVETQRADARREIERRVQLKRQKAGSKNSTSRMSLKLLSPEEQLERIRSQDKARQAKRYARLKSMTP